MDISQLIAQATAYADKAADDASAGGGWLSAVAKAMGKALGIQAARVVALSNAIAENASQRGEGGVIGEGEGGGGKLCGGGGDDRCGTGEGSASQTGRDTKLAAEAMVLNTQFQAASQELSITSNAFATAIKALGEGSTTLARKN